MTIRILNIQGIIKHFTFVFAIEEDGNGRWIAHTFCQFNDWGELDKGSDEFVSDNKKIRLHFGARTSTISGLPQGGPVYEIPSIFSPKVFLGSRSGGVPSGSPNFDTISEQYL